MANTAAAKGRLSPPALALGPDAAAASLGISRDTFDRHVLAQLKVVRIGGRIVVPVRELERYLERNAATPLNEWLSR